MRARAMSMSDLKLTDFADISSSDEELFAEGSWSVSTTSSVGAPGCEKHHHRHYHHHHHKTAAESWSSSSFMSESSDGVHHHRSHHHHKHYHKTGSWSSSSWVSWSDSEDGKHHREHHHRHHHEAERSMLKVASRLKSKSSTGSLSSLSVSSDITLS